MRIREYTLPAAGARPRRIALAPDGTVYYTDFARGYLGHFDPSTGRLLKEWCRRAARIQNRMESRSQVMARSGAASRV